MGKGKPRWYPEKPQNNYGNFCTACDLIGGRKVCEAGQGTKLFGFGQNVHDTDVCQGNPHNCIKLLYRRMAVLSNHKRLEIFRKGEK